MLKSVKITNYLGDSVEYKIADCDVNGNNGLLITEIEGLGSPDADIHMTELQTSDGGIYNSSRVKGRNIVIHAEYTWADTIEEARLRTYKFFPIGKKLTFEIETDKRKAYTTGYVQSNKPNIFSEQADMQISVLCESPYFLDADGETDVLFSAVVPMFEFVYENEGAEPVTEIGEIIHKKESSVFYDGDVETGCKIVMHAIGEVRQIKVYNIRTRERMIIDTDKLERFSGHPYLAPGEEIIINTIPGQKSMTFVKDGESTNIINLLGRHSDWFLLAKGDNVFSYTAEYGEENLYFKITSQINYEGV